MAKAFHNLAGLCRDLRAATIAASEGDYEAQKLVDDFDDAMELLDAHQCGDLADGEDPDAPASGNDAEDTSPPAHRADGGRDERVGGGELRPTVHSTRDRMRRDTAPGRREGVAVPACVPTAVVPARARARGRR